MKKIIIIAIMTAVLAPGLVLSQSIEMPKTIDESKELGEKVIETAEKELPGIIQGIWAEKVLPIWRKMWDWFRTNIWTRIESWLSPEIEKRKEYLKEGFGREKEEIKEEIKTEAPKVGQSLWKKFKDLIK